MTGTAEGVLNEIRDAMETRGYFHMANGRDIGALIAEKERLEARVEELLATTTAYLEDARQARRERDALLHGFKGMAGAMIVALKMEGDRK